MSDKVIQKAMPEGKVFCHWVIKTSVKTGTIIRTGCMFMHRTINKSSWTHRMKEENII